MVAASDTFRKALLIAAGSYFEYRIASCVLDHVSARSTGSVLVLSFFRNKAVNRQYHTWFKWDESNANAFFGLFGADFKRAMVDRVAKSDPLAESVRAFLEIGNERNKLAHQDFASFPLEKTMDEIYGLYGRALLFVDGLGAHLVNFDTPGPPKAEPAPV